MIFLKLYILYALCIVFVSVIEIDDFDDIAFTPKQLYESNDLNMFGCCIVFILGFVFDPLLYILYFIYWICHIGRRRWYKWLRLVDIGRVLMDRLRTDTVLVVEKWSILRSILMKNVLCVGQNWNGKPMIKVFGFMVKTANNLLPIGNCIFLWWKINKILCYEKLQKMTGCQSATIFR